LVKKSTVFGSENYAKYPEIIDFQAIIEPQKILFGPPVGHPWNEHKRSSTNDVTVKNRPF
jgi:hypothetical protein